MKYFVLSAGFAAIVTAVTITSSYAGVRDGGGGNGLHSTPKEVAEFIRSGDLSDNLGGLLMESSMGLGSKALLPIRNEHARQILSKILALKGVVNCSTI